MASQAERTSTARDFLSRQMDLLRRGFSFSGYERDLFCLNRGDGTFVDVSGVSGIDFIGDGRGASFADLDNDGDLDVFLRAMHGRAHLLFRNALGQDAGFVRVALQGTRSGRDAFGATVRLATSAGTIAKVKSGGSGFLSQSDPRLLFGLGADSAAEWMEVSWPSGAVQRFPGPKAGQSLLVVEGEPSPRRIEERRFSLPAPESPEDAAWRGLKVRKGETLPALALLDVEGRPAPGASVVGRARTTVVSFWATWCAPCARELPELQRLSSASQGRLAVVGLSVDDASTRGAVPGYVKAAGLELPIFLVPTAELAKVQDARDLRVPLNLVLDEKGRVVEVLSGWSRATRERLEALAGGAR